MISKYEGIRLVNLYRLKLHKFDKIIQSEEEEADTEKKREAG